jgi:hypothetical protein
MLAVATPPAPLWVELTAPVVLFFNPPVVARTLTAKVQEPAADRVAPVSDIDDEAATAVIVPPPQLPVRPLGVATTRPTGSGSVKATPVRATAAFGLVRVKLRAVVSPMENGFGPADFGCGGEPGVNVVENALVIAGGLTAGGGAIAGLTVRVKFCAAFGETPFDAVKIRA